MIETINCDICGHEFSADEYGDNEVCDKCGAVYGYEEGLRLKNTGETIKDANGNTFVKLADNDNGGAKWACVSPMKETNKLPLEIICRKMYQVVEKSTHTRPNLQAYISWSMRHIDFEKAYYLVKGCFYE